MDTTLPRLVTAIVTAKRDEKTPNGIHVWVREEEMELAKTLVACKFARYQKVSKRLIQITAAGMKAYNGKVQ